MGAGHCCVCISCHPPMAPTPSTATTVIASLPSAIFSLPAFSSLHQPSAFSHSFSCLQPFNHSAFCFCRSFSRLLPTPPPGLPCEPSAPQFFPNASHAPAPLPFLFPVAATSPTIEVQPEHLHVVHAKFAACILQTHYPRFLLHFPTPELGPPRTLLAGQWRECDPWAWAALGHLWLALLTLQFSAGELLELAFSFHACKFGKAPFFPCLPFSRLKPTHLENGGR